MFVRDSCRIGDCKRIERILSLLLSHDKLSAAILLVDDDDAMRRVLEFQLLKAGHAAVGVADGKAAFGRFSAEEFDCIITDWRMPEMGGSQPVTQATTINSEIPIIVIIWRCRYCGRSDAPRRV